MTSLTLPFVSLPKLVIPECLAKIAASLGFLASKRSATRGNPPVMSLVLEDSRGILAKTSPYKGMNHLKTRFPKLHYVRFKSEDERIKMNHEISKELGIDTIDY